MLLLRTCFTMQRIICTFFRPFDIVYSVVMNYVTHWQNLMGFSVRRNKAAIVLPRRVLNTSNSIRKLKVSSRVCNHYHICSSAHYRIIYYYQIS